MNPIVYKYQFLQFTRNRPLLFALLILFNSGIYSAFYGKHFVAQQDSILYSVDTLEQGNVKRFEQYVKTLPDSLKKGNRGYLENPSLKYRPTAFTGLAIGQKDNFPFYHKVNDLQNIYQQNTAKIQNPMKLLAGNFDLSFVIVYLFPLFIIVLGYNVLSEEREQHTATLLKVQADFRKVIFQKLVFRMLMMLFLSIILNICSFAIVGVSLTEAPQMCSWILVTLLYTVFWFVVVFLVVAFDLPGSVNALILGGIWVFLLLIIPTVVNRQVSASHQHDQVEMMFSSRGDIPSPYDMEPAELRDSFNRIVHRYPLPDTTDTSRTGRVRLKSLMVNVIKKHADNSLGRKALEGTYAEYQHALHYNVVNPGFVVQNIFNQLGNSEISNFWTYMNAIEEFETERLYFLNRYYAKPKDFSFENDPKPIFKFTEQTIGPLKTLVMIWPLILFGFLIALLARTLYRKGS